MLIYHGVLGLSRQLSPRQWPVAPQRACARCCSADFASRSTARIEEDQFAQGTCERRRRLHEALEAIGIDVQELTESPELAGSAALRHYTSFVHPKSAGALANAEKPQRAATIANSIAFRLREQRAATNEWLCNHDRALDALPRRSPHPLVLVLDNVRSAANTGNILRAAEAALVRHVYLCGMTPAPPDAKVLKTALGAAAYVPHSKRGSTLELVRELQAAGYAVWAAETTSRSVRYDARPMPQPLALVLGNEVIGVDTQAAQLVGTAVSGAAQSRTAGSVGRKPYRLRAALHTSSGATRPRGALSQRLRCRLLAWERKAACHTCDAQVQEACDALVRLPCHGVKNSLNVATACSVLLWEALRQWDPPDAAAEE